jgi:hypothetical protein
MDDIDDLIGTIKERLRTTSSAQEFINSFPEDESNSMRVERRENLPLEKIDSVIFLQMKVYSEEIVNFYKIVRGSGFVQLYIEILGKNLGQTKMYFIIKSTLEE